MIINYNLTELYRDALHSKGLSTTEFEQGAGAYTCSNIPLHNTFLSISFFVLSFVDGIDFNYATLKPDRTRAIRIIGSYESIKTNLFLFPFLFFFFFFFYILFLFSYFSFSFHSLNERDIHPAEIRWPAPLKIFDVALTFTGLRYLAAFVSTSSTLISISVPGTSPFVYA